MGNSSGVPKLRNDAAAGGMHGVCDQAPSAHLIRAPQSGGIGKAKAVSTDRGRFRDDQSSRSTLGIVFGLQRGRHVIHRPSAHAGERCHDDAIGQIQIAHTEWGKERLDGHDGAPGQGIKR